VRRLATAAIMAVALAFPARAQSPERAPPAAPAPNVLVITLDTTRRDAMGFLGHSPSITPNLDALAKQSIVFGDAITTAPLTLPAHCSLMTGLYPSSHGVHDNSLYRLSSDATTLAEMLKDAGYVTGAAIAGFVLDPVFGLDQGFDRYSAPPRGVSAATTRLPERRAHAMVDQALADLAELGPAATHAAGSRGSADAGETATAAGRPFFYWLHLFDPHAPYDPPNPPPISPTLALDPAAVSRAMYEAEIAQMDAELGRLFEELKRRGAWDPTIVVVAADHGEGLGEGHEKTHGHFLFDPTVRIPLLLRDPRVAPARVAIPVSLVDVAPTLLARLGVGARSERFDGIDLSPWMLDPTLAAPDRVLALETWYVWLQYGWAPFEGCTLGPLKYLRSQHDELFDRAADPTESSNLFAPDDARARGLARRLAALREAGASLAAAHPGLSDADRAALRALGYATGGSNAEAPAREWSELPDAYTKLDAIRGFDDASSAIEKGDAAGAIALLRQLVEREPDSALFHENLGLMLVNAGLKDDAALADAERELRRTLDLDPRRARVWFGLARCALHRRDAARAEAKRLRESGDPKSARAPAAAERDAATAADRALRECLRLEPTYPEALFELCRLLLDEGDRAARANDREQALARFTEMESIASRLLAAVPKDSAEARPAEGVLKLAQDRKAANQ
jgi:arylsulfatase A-like enzyme